MAAIVDMDRLRQMRASLPAEQLAQVDIEALIAQAIEALEARDAAGAERILQAAVMLDPEDAGCWALMGEAEEALGYLPEARTAYGHALALDADDTEVAFALARVQRRLNDPAAARALYNWMLLEFETPDVLERAHQGLKEVDGEAQS